MIGFPGGGYYGGGYYSGGYGGPTGVTNFGPPDLNSLEPLAPETAQKTRPFNENLLYYNAGVDQPIMWKGGRDPMRSGEFFAPALALHNRSITGWLDELARPIDTVGPTSFRAQEMGLSPTMAGYHPGAQRDLMMNQLLNKFAIPSNLANEALMGLKGGELERSWLAEHALNKERTPSNGFFKRVFGLV